MVEYNTVNAKLSNSQLNKLKSAVKNKQGTTLRISAKMFNSDNLPHELLLITRQTTKLRNEIVNIMSTDISCLKLRYLNNSIWRISRQTSWSIIKN